MTVRVGEQLAQYKLIRLLGRGGFAEVYLGEHRHLKSLAAIKVLQASLNDEETEGFLREARTLAALRHPHIVRILDFAVEQGTPFLAMEYAQGGTLRQQHPRESTIPLATVVSYVNQVADALQYAHDARFIHRDVKPENMLLNQHGAVLLGDFGIALMLQTSHIQSVQEVIGSISYMAPEQLQGQPQRASDQYALAVVVYEWLSGDCPFHGSFSEIASQHLLVLPPSLRAQVPTIPPGVEDVLIKALAKDPKERFASVQAFATALSQAATGAATQIPLDNIIPTTDLQAIQAYEGAKTELAAPSSLPPPDQVSSALITPTTLPPSSDTDNLPDASTLLPILPSPARRFVKGQGKRLPWTRLALATLALLIIIGGSIALRYTVTKYQIAEKYANATSSANAQSSAIYNSEATFIATLTDSPTANISASATANARINTLATADALAATNSSMFGLNAQHTNFNPREHILSTANIAHLQLKWMLPLIGSNHVGYTSPVVINGVMYVCAFDKTLYAFDSTIGTFLWSASTETTPPGGFGSIDASPAIVNGIVYVGSLDGNLYAFDATTGKMLWKVRAGNTIYTSPTVANGMVFVASQDNNLHAFDAKTGKIVWAAPAGSPPPPGLVPSYASPAVDNGVVYFGSWDANLYAFDARTGKNLWMSPTRTNIESTPTVANGMVYIGDWTGDLYAFDAGSGTQLWHTLLGSEPILSSPAVANGLVYANSEDGRLFAFDAFTGAAAPLWNVPFTTLPKNFVKTSTPTIANGVIYFTPLDGHLYALNAKTGAQLWSYPVGNRTISTPEVINGVIYVGSDTGLYAFHLPGVS